MINRDPEFWNRISNHPDVAKTKFGEDVSFEAVTFEHVFPFSSKHGGYILVKIHPICGIWDLHAMFTPEGWGKEAHALGVELLNTLPQWQLITAQETQFKNSQPPRSFGFVEAGPFTETPYGDWRTWILTRKAWEGSPAKLRSDSKCLKR